MNNAYLFFSKIIPNKSLEEAGGGYYEVVIQTV